jgi:RNA recognition motif-containing protein
MPRVAGEKTSSDPSQEPLLKTESFGVHIGKIPQSITLLMLKSWVSQQLSIEQNKIEDVELYRSQSGDKKGYAIVTFGTTEMAQYAVKNLKTATCQGYTMSVKLDRNQKVTEPKPAPQPSRGLYGRAKKVSSSFRSDYNDDIKGFKGFKDQSTRRVSAPERTSPAVVDGSISRLNLK